MDWNDRIGHKRLHRDFIDQNEEVPRSPANQVTKHMKHLMNFYEKQRFDKSLEKLTCVRQMVWWGQFVYIRWMDKSPEDPTNKIKWIRARALERWVESMFTRKYKKTLATRNIWCRHMNFNRGLSKQFGGCLAHPNVTIISFDSKNTIFF